MNARIKEIREYFKLSQREFSKRIDVGQSTLAMFETGDRIPRGIHINRICSEFNVNEDWLRNGNGEMFIEIDKENQLMIWSANILKDENDSFRRRFVKMLMDLDESDWETLEKVATKLHEKS